MSDAETASILAALRGELRWYCTACKVRLAPDASPKSHGCPVVVAIEPTARTADEIYDMMSPKPEERLPPGWYWISIAKHASGGPMMAHGPFTEAEVSPS